MNTVIQKPDSRVHSMDGILLTDGEVQTLNWLSLGKRAKDIAMIMECKTDDVYWRIKRVQEKLSCNTICGAVGKALRSGLIK